MIPQNTSVQSRNPARRLQERGQDLVEFAIVLPILLLLLLGIMEFGILVYDYNAISNAAREGARYGLINPANQVRTACPATPPASVDSIMDAVCNLTTALDLTQMEVQSRITAITNEPGLITVTVWYRAYLITAPILEALGGSGFVDLNATTSMLIEP